MYKINISQYNYIKKSNKLENYIELIKLMDTVDTWTEIYFQKDLQHWVLLNRSKGLDSFPSVGSVFKSS